MTDNTKSKELYFSNKLLISTNNLRDSFFDQTVIYLVSHNADGAMGVIINKQIEQSSLADIAEQFGITRTDILYDAGIYFGGPVEVGKGFVIHTSEYTSGDTIDNENGISMTSSLEIVEDISEGKGPLKYIVSLGYAGWEAGQLEKEIYENSWLVAPSDAELMFDTSNFEKWSKAAKAIGVDINRVSEMVGNA